MSMTTFEEVPLAKSDVSGMCLTDRLAAIMDEVGAIGKSQENREQHYKYRGIEDITARLQRLLAKYKVVIVPQYVDMQRADFATAKGGVMHAAYSSVQWNITCATGEVLTAHTFGEGFDMSDKATNKAATSAYKYLLLQLFMVADPKDDGDATSPVETVGYVRRDQQSMSSSSHSSVTESSPQPRSAPPQGGGPRPITEKQVALVAILAEKCGLDTKESRSAYIRNIVGREYGSSKNLTSQEASKVIDALNAYKNSIEADDDGYEPLSGDEDF